MKRTHPIHLHIAHPGSHSLAARYILNAINKSWHLGKVDRQFSLASVDRLAYGWSEPADPNPPPTEDVHPYHVFVHEALNQQGEPDESQEGASFCNLPDGSPATLFRMLQFPSSGPKLWKFGSDLMHEFGHNRGICRAPTTEAYNLDRVQRHAGIDPYLHRPDRRRSPMYSSLMPLVPEGDVRFEAALSANLFSWAEAMLLNGNFTGGAPCLSEARLDYIGTFSAPARVFHMPAYGPEEGIQVQTHTLLAGHYQLVWPEHVMAIVLYPAARAPWVITVFDLQELALGGGTTTRLMDDGVVMPAVSIPALSGGDAPDLIPLPDPEPPPIPGSTDEPTVRLTPLGKRNLVARLHPTEPGASYTLLEHPDPTWPVTGDPNSAEGWRRRGTQTAGPEGEMYFLLDNDRPAGCMLAWKE